MKAAIATEFLQLKLALFLSRPGLDPGKGEGWK
jgi:hypothetical protein